MDGFSFLFLIDLTFDCESLGILKLLSSVICVMYIQSICVRNRMFIYQVELFYAILTPEYFRIDIIEAWNHFLILRVINMHFNHLVTRSLYLTINNYLLICWSIIDATNAIKFTFKINFVLLLVWRWFTIVKILINCAHTVWVWNFCNILLDDELYQRNTGRKSCKRNMLHIYASIFIQTI